MNIVRIVNSLFTSNTFVLTDESSHDWSCMSYYTNEVIFTGDSYIPKIKVITSFPKSNKMEAKVSLDRILKFCKTRDVYPGHNEIEKHN